MSELTINQHYIPRFILRNWAINEQVWVLNKNENKIFKTNIENICLRRFLYDCVIPEFGVLTENCFEKGFAKYEDEMAPYLRTLIKKFDDDMTYRLINEDCEKLSNFLYSISVRHPDSLKNIAGNWVFDTPNDIDDETINEIINNDDTLKRIDQEIGKNNAFELIVPRNNGPGLLAGSLRNTDKCSYCYILKNDNHNFFASDILASLISTPEWGKVNYLPLSPTYCFVCREKPVPLFNENEINKIDDDFCYECAIYFNNTDRCKFIISDSKEKLEKLRLRLERKNNNEY